MKLKSLCVVLANLLAWNTGFAQVTGKINKDIDLSAQVQQAEPATTAAPIVIHKPAAKKPKPLLNKAQELPGVGELPGYKDYYKPVVVQISNAHTSVVDVSQEFQNRISTPFRNPQVMDKSNADINTLGQSVYFTPAAHSKPVTIFIMEADAANSPVLSLTLVPKQIPSQTILLQVEKTELQALASPQDEDKPTSDVYTENLRYLFRQVAMGKIPAGYSDAPLPNAVLSMKGLVIVPVTRFSGPKGDIYAYRVEGATGTPIELHEEQFYKTGIRAISFFPTATVKFGNPTMVYIFANRMN